MEKIRAAAVQLEHAPGDKEKNFAKIRAFTALAHRQKVDLLVFPECCITGYFFLRHLSRDKIATLAERVPDGPSSQKLLKLARETGMTIGAGLVEITAEGKLYNTWVAAL